MRLSGDGPFAKPREILMDWRMTKFSLTTYERLLTYLL